MTKKKSVQIVVPVYNEEKELEENILKLYDFSKKNLKKYKWNIVISDNASTDLTPSIAKKLSKKYKEIILLKLKEKGRGRAVKSAWNKFKSDFYVYMDLDLSTDLKHLPKILAALEKGNDIAIGSRLAKGSKVEGRTFLRELTSRTLNYMFIQFWFRTHFSDAQCGFKGVSHRVVENLLPHILDNEWFFDGEMLILAEKSGYKIYEEPVHWIDNPGSTVRLVSTISGDIKVMWRLYWTKPWKNVTK